MELKKIQILFDNKKPEIINISKVGDSAIFFFHYKYWYFRPNSSYCLIDGFNVKDKVHEGMLKLKNGTKINVKVKGI